MQPIRRTDQVSKSMYNVIQKSIIQHRELTNQIKKANEDITGVTVPAETTPVDPIEIPLVDAMASGRFTYKQFGLYKEADTDESFGRIWVKKDIVDPKTGTKEEWLVVYTNEEEELIRQIANDKLKEIKAAQPNPKDIPIAQGIKSKNITIDESGASGTAKVTVEFTNVDQGLKFYQEDVAGGNKAEAPAEDQKPEPAEEDMESADKPPVAAPAAPGAGPQVQPGPMPSQGMGQGQASLKSDGLKKRAANGGENVMFEGIGQGAKQGGEEKIVQSLQNGTPVSYNNPQAIQLVRNNPRYLWIKGTEGITVIGIYYNNAWVIAAGHEQEAIQVYNNLTQLRQQQQASLKSDGIKKEAEEKGYYSAGGNSVGGKNVPYLPPSKDVNVGGDRGDNYFPRMNEQGPGSEDDDVMAFDAFGEILMTGDRVRDEADRKGVIESIVDPDNARVKWDSSDLADEGFGGEFSTTVDEIPDSFTPGIAVEVVPTTSLKKWAGKTTIRKMTRAGAQVMDIIKDVYPNEVKYSFVNEGGYSVELDITEDLRTGAQIMRPDTKQVARVGYFKENKFADKNVIADEILADMDVEIPGTVEDAANPVVAKKGEMPPWLKKDKDEKDDDKDEKEDKDDDDKDDDDKDDDDDKKDKKKDKKDDDKDEKEDDDDEKEDKESSLQSITNDLIKEALDVSDQVAPMSWKSDGNEGMPAGAGPSLPPKDDLQPGQNGNQPDPNNPADAQPVYDSAKGQAPSFQTTVNPDDRSVTVKFVDNVQQQKLDQTVQQNTPNPTAPTPAANPAAPAPQLPGMQGAEFDDLNSPNQF